MLYVCNVDEASAASGNAYVEQVREAIKDEGAELLVVAAKIESEIAELDTYEERQMFLAEAGLEESGVNRLIKAAYRLLDLETFLTAGPDEVRVAVEQALEAGKASLEQAELSARMSATPPLLGSVVDQLGADIVSGDLAEGERFRLGEG